MLDDLIDELIARHAKRVMREGLSTYLTMLEGMAKVLGDIGAVSEDGTSLQSILEPELVLLRSKCSSHK